MQRPSFRLLAELEKSQWLPPEQFKNLQLEKLKSLLRSSATNSPWHAEGLRQAGISFSEIDALGLDALQRLPLMTKADASAFREQLVWKKVPGGAHLYNTGGSSGQPLIFYFGRSRQATDAATRMRARKWWGVDIGEPEVFLWGAPVELNKTDKIKQVRDRIFNQLLLNAFDMSEAAMDDYLKRIAHFNPSCIYGYASSLSLLASHAISRGVSPKIKNLKVVCTTGESLSSEQRNLIQSVFKAPVSNEYGCRDGGLVAIESPDGELLVNSDTLLLEILAPDGSPVADGEIGEAVITHLHSEAQPFIRYRTGDMVRKSSAPSKSGRSLQVIGEVSGRATDFIVRPDGAIMHALSVIYVLRSIEGVGEFKIIQHLTDYLDVVVVPSAGWQDSAKDVIIEQLKRRVGQTIKVDVNLTQKIAPESSGKYRYVVSHVPLPDRLRFHG
jgi:phenylacetate-CoA ligase